MAVTPRQAADGCLDRADALLAGAAAGAVGDDQARLALVLGVSALDTYLHMRVLRSVESRGALRGAVASVELPFSDLVALSEKLKQAQDDAERKNKKKTTKKKATRKSAPRPWVPMKRMLRERLLRDTFQSSRGVENALRMVGVRNPWSKLSGRMGLTTEEIKDALSAIVHRRNQIVHEGDMKRMDRPRKITLNEIDRGEVGHSLAWIRGFVQHVDAL